LPHESLDFEEMSRVVPATDLPKLRSVRPDVPELLAEVFDRCVRRNPEERYASASEVCDALEAVEGLFRTLRLTDGAPRPGGEIGDDDVATVKASYARVAVAADRLVARFYERLFAAEPEFRPMFPTDLREQRLKFASALQLTIENLQKPDVLGPLLEE